MLYGVVYRITCTENSKCYIGRTKRSLHQRWYDHWRGRSFCPYLRRAINKYGKESFTIEAIASSWDDENLRELEVLMIRQENTLSPNGYNLVNTNVGPGEISEETREKHRLQMMGNKIAVGTIYTDELRAIKSEVAKSQWTPEKKTEQAAAWTDNKINLGRVQSIEERQQRSEAQKASPSLSDRIAKLAESNKGKQNALGYRHTNDELEKISAASKRRHLQEHGITFNGETLTSTDWAARIGITSSTLLRRIELWGVEKALTTPPGDTRSESQKERHLRNGINFNGEIRTLTGWADKIGICRASLLKRIDRWGLEKALSIPPR
jgi:group I intron endonuclease